jgi:GNAT superfamily N-acetyltransferase
VLVVGSETRSAPGWDGAVHPVIGVSAGRDAGVVLSVPPAVGDEVGGSYESVEAAGAAVAGALGQRGRRVVQAMFRWCETPSALGPLGEWVDAADPRVPDWLRPFNGGVLVALEGDRYLAGVGIKRHDRWGHELAVGTDEAARGRGLARRLVAEAARVVLADGGVPTYLHDFANVASARVADAAGFPDRGWRVLGLAPG